MKQKKRYIITIIILIIVIFIFFRSQVSLGDSEDSGFGVSVDSEKVSDFEVLASNLEIPWAIDFLPDNRIIFTQRPGKVSILNNGKLEVVGEIDVSHVQESGLLGIAVDPDFKQNKYLYLYYTHQTGNRISRFVLNDKLKEEFILLDDIPRARFHDGGRLKFGVDGKLYATTGDATEPSSAQDINSLAGKILRMNKDGSIPDDNPFGNYVYSYGHRNSQGIAWNSKNELFASEHGPTRNDEINFIEKGKNYGWPFIECNEISNEYENAVRCFSEFTLAPSSIAFYNDDLYVVGLRGKQLRKITLDSNYKVIKEEVIINDLGRIRDVVSHGDYLYIATSNRDGRGIPRIGDDKIIRVRYKDEVITI